MFVDSTPKEAGGAFGNVLGTFAVSDAEVANQGPLVVLADSRHLLKKFRYVNRVDGNVGGSTRSRSGVITAAGLSRFVADWQGGVLKPYRRSDPVPPPPPRGYGGGSVVRVVGDRYI